MRLFASALVSLSLIAGLASVAAAPAAAEPGYTVKKKKKHPRHRSAYRAYDGEYYHQRWAQQLPFGTTSWWHQMDTEQRGGRR